MRSVAEQAPPLLCYFSAAPRLDLGRTSAAPRPHLGRTSAAPRPHLGAPPPPQAPSGSKERREATAALPRLEATAAARLGSGVSLLHRVWSLAVGCGGGKAGGAEGG